MNYRRFFLYSLFKSITSPITLKLLLPLIALTLWALFSALIYVPPVFEKNIYLAAERTAEEVIKKHKILRNYYTENVVQKVLASGAMEASMDHLHNPKAIPLPATLIQDLSDLYAKEGLTLKLFSPYPFPPSKDRKLDSFQQQAWDLLSRNPNETFSRAETMNGRTTIRVALADTLSQACVSCHNSHPQSPKTDWQAGDVRGVLEVDQNITAQLLEGKVFTRKIVLIILSTSLLLLGVTLHTTFTVCVPLTGMIQIMHDLAENRTDVVIPRTEGKDEIHDLYDALTALKTYAADRNLLLEHLEKRTLVLKRTNEDLEDFTYVASHDLKEPLRGLSILTSLLLETYADKLDAEGVQKLQRLTFLSQRMNQLVSDLLHYARLGRDEVAIQELDPNAVVREIEKMIEPLLKEKNARIVIPQPMPHVVCDKPGIMEIFRNLIINAVHYNDKTDKLVEVGMLKSLAAPHGLEKDVFYVKDNGIGIDPQFHRDIIFKMFKRLPSSAHYDRSGTGSGLTFVKKIVERNHGRIWLDSTPAAGTTFYFTLPSEGGRLSDR